MTGSPSHRWSIAVAGLVVLGAVTLPPPGAAADPLGPGGRLHQSAALGSAPGDPRRSEGRAVALSADGRTAVLGSEPTQYGLRGQVHVFVLRDGSWEQRATLRQPDRPRRLSAWGTAVAISGDGRRIAVGDHDADGAGGVQYAGTVDTYRRTPHGFARTQRVRAPGRAASVSFGWSLALSEDGSRLLVGALTAPGAFVFDAVGVRRWGRPVELPNPAGPYDLNFGAAVALSGDGRTAVVEVASAGNLDSSQRAAYSFTSGARGVWALDHTFSTDTVNRYGAFARSLAISADGGTVAVGDPEAVPPITTVFDRQSTGWSRSAVFTGRDTARTGEFGDGIALSADGDTVLVTASGRSAEHGTIYATGGGYRFQRDAAGWHWGGLVYADQPRMSDQLGRAVALSSDGRTALLGSRSPLYGALVFTG